MMVCEEVYKIKHSTQEPNLIKECGVLLELCSITYLAYLHLHNTYWSWRKPVWVVVIYVTMHMLQK